MARLAIRMPKMSMTMTEGEVSEWAVKVGDEIAVGDVVAEVMTDKVDMEVESTVAGTLVEIVVESGMADVGAPIGYVEGEDDGGGFGDLLAAPDQPSAAQPADDVCDTTETTEGVPATEAPSTTLAAEPAGQVAPPQAPPPATAAPVAAAPPVVEPSPPVVEPSPAVVEPVETTGPVAAVPRARGLARERGIDLAGITGSGPDGLIRVADVEAASAPVAPAAPAAAPAAAQPVAATALAAAVAQPVAQSVAQPVVAAPKPDQTAARRTAVRRAVARVMVPTAVIPQFTVWRELHLDAADGLRQGLSWTTVLLRAYAAALREVPELLSRWEDDAPTVAGPPVVALAVATDRGLLVPNFAEPDAKDARALDAEIRTVVKAAHGGKVDGAYLGVANASLSNLGGMGVDRFQALLTPPQASVLSLGTIRRRPVAVEGGIGVALTVEAGITVDHRVADGAHGAEVLDRIAQRLSGGL